MDDLLPAAELAETCLCLGLQQSARRLAQRYDNALRPVGLTSGQFSILGALNRDAPVPLGALATILGMDRTTLTRNLQRLEARNLVADATDADDARVRALRLTADGRALLGTAVPLWRLAQADGLARLGSDWPALRRQLQALAAG